MTRNNNRSLDEIADSINKRGCDNIIADGEDLLEAKAKTEHGEWLDWLEAEFGWSHDTASKYMRVAELASKFRNLRNLKLGKTTLYTLVEYEFVGTRKHELQATLIDELAKHATKARLRPRDAKRVIQIGIGRYYYGDDYPDAPDATLKALADVDNLSGDTAEAVCALLEQMPTTDEIAQAIIQANPPLDDGDDDDDGDGGDDDDGEEDDEEEEEEDEDEDAAEAAATLEGPPPAVPPPSPAAAAVTSAAQRLAATTPWPEEEQFSDCVVGLHKLRGKPVDRFTKLVAREELREVIDFLKAILKAKEEQPMSRGNPYA